MPNKPSHDLLLRRLDIDVRGDPHRTRTVPVQPGTTGIRTVQLDGEPAPRNGTPLLHPAVRDGTIVADLPPVSEIQRQASANVEALPHRYRALHDPTRYPVRRSPGILELRERAIAQGERGALRC